jgi:hypothetical protein
MKDNIDINMDEHNVSDHEHVFHLNIAFTFSIVYILPAFYIFLCIYY